MTAPRKALYVSFFAFVAGAALFWFLQGVKIGAVSYAPTRQTLSFASPLDAAVLAFRCSRTALLESAIVFIAGFSVFPAAGTAPVLFFRGACFGAVLRAIVREDVLFPSEGSFLGVPTGVLVPLLYALSSFCIMGIASAAAFFSERFVGKSDGKFGAAAVYAAVFSVFSGAVILLEFFRLTAV